jgi:predicted O-methyltransferase YrrM
MKVAPAFDQMGHETPALDRRAIERIVRSMPGCICVEVGTWAGLSALRMAEAGASRVYCIDHWLGNANDDLSYAAQFYGQRHAFQTFCSNMGHFLFDTVIPLVGTSKQWASVWPSSFVDFVYIDAEHDYEDVWQDISMWKPHIRPGGIIAGHDYNVFPGVNKAVHEHFTSVNVENFIWWVKL